MPDGSGGHGGTSAELPARSRLCVALDFADRAALLAAARELAPLAGHLKVGLEAFVSHGPGLVEEVRATGARVFLDLKLHDIPNTVGAAAAAAARTGASLVTLHASGGAEMLRAAARAVREVASSAGTERPRLLGVTVLTSLDTAACAEVGFAGTPAELARNLALLAKGAELDGVVCSPEEAAEIRAACGPGFLLVVPGIRPAGSEASDQKRIATPERAIRAGADILVVGRPITQARDRAAAAGAILAEIAAAIELGIPEPRGRGSRE